MEATLFYKEGSLKFLRLVFLIRSFFLVLYILGEGRKKITQVINAPWIRLQFVIFGGKVKIKI